MTAISLLLRLQIRLFLRTQVRGQKFPVGQGDFFQGRALFAVPQRAHIDSYLHARFDGGARPAAGRTRFPRITRSFGPPAAASPRYLTKSFDKRGTTSGCEEGYRIYVDRILPLLCAPRR